MPIDMASKNGNLMLNIPVRGDGSIDEQEIACVEHIGRWMGTNSEGIYSTRPWKVYGEGPSTLAGGRGRRGGAPGGAPGGGRDVRPYSPTDFRFTTKPARGGADSAPIIYAFMMGWPEDGKATITTMAEESEQTMLGLAAFLTPAVHPCKSRNGTRSQAFVLRAIRLMDNFRCP